MIRRLVFASMIVLAAPMAVHSQNDSQAPGNTMDQVPSYLVTRELPEEIIALQTRGEFTAAEKQIEEALSNNPENPEAWRIELQRIQRVRRDFGLSADGMLEKLRVDIPDVTASDLERWRASGDIQSIVIDGEARFFRKEPRNLYRINKEARDRKAIAANQDPAAPEADPNARKTTTFDLHEHVESVLEATDASRKDIAAAVRMHCKHRVIIDADAVAPGETLRCWIPFPQEYERQGNVELIAASHDNPVVAENGALHRTVYLEGPAAAAGQKTEFWIEYAYTTAAYAPNIKPETVKVLFPNHPTVREYIQSQPPHVDLTPELRELAKGIVGDEKNPFRIAEKIFRWMDENIKYCSEMEYSIFTSITDKVMTDRRGDCGIHVLMFVALCRASGVPARWQSGWAMRPGNENLHDWAEFYVEPYGWLPADPSFGLRRHDNPRVRDFYIGHIDAFRMIANLDYGAEFTPPKQHWRSDNIDNQRGEVEWSGGNLYYDQWTYRMTVEYEFLDDKPASEANLDDRPVTNIDGQ